MSVPALHFREIVIDRLDGLEPSGFALAELEPGINIVYGPNASGKTSLCGAIRQLLAPKEPSVRFRRSVLHGALQMDLEPLFVRFDMGDVDIQRGSSGQGMPLLVPEGIRDRYIFSLHDLLQGDAADMAEELLKQAAGGFDLRAAREALDFHRQISNRNSGAYKALIAAQKRVETVRAEQQQLVEEERRLADLEIEYSQTRQASARARLLERAVAWNAARRAVEDRAEDLARFPAALAGLCGDEMERLRQFRAKLATLRGQNDQNTAARQAAQERLEGTAFGSNLPDEPLTGALRQKCQCLRTLIASLEERKTKLVAAEKIVQQARKVLGDRAPAPDDALLDPEKASRLLALAHQGTPLRGKLEAASELGGWLAQLQRRPSSATADALDRGIDLFNRWLAADEAANTHAASRSVARERFALTGGAIAGGVVAVILALTVHPIWLLGLLVSVGVLLWLLWASRANSTNDPLPALQAEFAKLGLPSPKTWSPEAVGTRLRELQKDAREAAFEQVRTARWSDLETRVLDCRKRWEAHANELAHALKEAGLADEILKSGEGAMVVLATNIVRCQEAYCGWEALKAEVAHLQKQSQDQLADIARTLSVYGYATPDVETAAAQVEDLSRRLTERDAADCELKACEKESRRLAAEIESVQAQLTALFQATGVEPEDDTELYRRLERLPRYQEADEVLKRARRDLELTARDLGDVAPFEGMPAETLAAQLAECREQADRAEDIHQQIIEIQTLVQKAKQKSELEAALAGAAKAEGDSALQREADCDAMAGDLLSDFLDEEQRDFEQPAVLERARHLFGRITHGRYRLETSRAGEGKPAFRAIETASLRVLPLDQLSGGTRLQLLFAVRLAFLEMQESQWKLPLVLDETLGNSDEARAEQIIDAAIEICRQGRQVFYLTAQHDEVSKWRRRLKDCADIRWKHVDLAEVRNFSASERVPLVDYVALPPLEVADPEGDDWLEYGRRLRVARPDAYGKPEELHPWYMVDDVPLLYRLLKRGINLWGQLRELIALGSLPSDCKELAPGSPAFLRAEARAGLVEAVFRYWRIGRGKPVDRSVLEASAAVGERFLPEVTQLARELSGDARRLLEALADGRVPRFLQRNREKLQQYLAESGFLDENDPLPLEMVKQRVKIEAFHLFDQGLIELSLLDLLIEMISQTSEQSVAATSD